MQIHPNGLFLQVWGEIEKKTACPNLFLWCNYWLQCWPETEFLGNSSARVTSTVVSMLMLCLFRLIYSHLLPSPDSWIKFFVLVVTVKRGQFRVRFVMLLTLKKGWNVLLILYFMSSLLQPLFNCEKIEKMHSFLKRENPVHWYEP